MGVGVRVNKTDRKNKVLNISESVTSVIQNTKLEVAHFFSSPIYLIERLDFLEIVSKVSEEHLEKQRKKHRIGEIYPVYMSENYHQDTRLDEFCGFIGGTAWNILNEQGYAMSDRALVFTEMWTQEHYKMSGMEQHIHGYGSQIVGFYFLETPENCSRVLFHDPRAGKVQIDLPEQDENFATQASKIVNFVPKPGLMVFANSWLAHSFTRHTADKPIKFVHFNLTVQAALPPPPPAEVV
jgi:uncharacterized protein (TIGR02466 family)